MAPSHNAGKRFLQLEEEDEHVFDKFMDKESELRRLEKIQTEKEAAENAKRAKMEKVKRQQDITTNVTAFGKSWRRAKGGAAPHEPAPSMANLVFQVTSRNNGGDSAGAGAGGGGGAGARVGVGLEQMMEAKLASFGAKQAETLSREMEKLHCALNSTTTTTASAAAEVDGSGINRSSWSSSASPSRFGDSSSLHLHQERVAQQQARLEAKIDAFSSTASSLMAKNCELEAQVAMLRGQLDARRRTGGIGMASGRTISASSFSSLLPGGGGERKF